MINIREGFVTMCKWMQSFDFPALSDGPFRGVCLFLCLTMIVRLLVTVTVQCKLRNVFHRSKRMWVQPAPWICLSVLVISCNYVDPYGQISH
jgi:hypothetical protein